jgi:chitinase
VRVSVDSVVNAYLRRGTPSRKLVIGTPFYGHGWTGVADGGTHGLFQPATAPADDPEFGAGTASFRTLEGFAGTGFRDPVSRGFWNTTAPPSGPTTTRARCSTRPATCGRGGSVA